MGISLTKKELAAAAGYTYRRLHDIDMGLPENKKLFVKGEGGKYDLALFVQRWVQYNVENETGGEKTLDEVRAQHEIVKTRKTELEVGRLEGRLVDVYEIRRLWGGVANTAMQNMMRLPSKAAPRLVMTREADVIERILEAEVREVMNNLADTPLPDGAEANDEEDGDESEES